MSVIVPFLPVLLELVVGDPLIVPPVAVPIVVSVVPSPAWVHIKIKSWDMAVINPAPVIIMRPIPTSFPWTPPPSTPEKQINLYIRSDVNIGRVRNYDHLRGSLKYDEWWQGNMNSDIYLCHRCSRNDN